MNYITAVCWHLSWTVKTDLYLRSISELQNSSIFTVVDLTTFQLYTDSCPELRKQIYIRSSVQFNSRLYLCARKSPYALHPVSQRFPQRGLWNPSNVHLIDDGPLSSFQGRSSSASFFLACLLQTIDHVTSLASCPHAPQQLISSPVITALTASLFRINKQGS